MKLKKFRNVPAIVTLLAGFITSVFMIINQYSLIKFMWVLVLVMIGFCIFGLIMRIVLNMAFQDKEENKEESDNPDIENSDTKEGETQVGDIMEDGVQ